MRVCADEAALRAAYDGVRHLAETNFKNGGHVLSRNILRRARHVEVQIFGNRFGEVVTLGERDCSIQRRNQKVIEESPAPNLPDDVREAMFASAKRLAAEVGYRSAGTIEFLYDPETCEFYFLEVNTRLQVEHGVTEEVLGIDLVEWMVREAADELTGSSIARAASRKATVFKRGFMRRIACSISVRARVSWISAYSRMKRRIETWVRDGMTVTTLYDPMLAKIIVHGEDRLTRFISLFERLDETRMYGITTNLQYVQALLQEEAIV